MRNKMIKSIRMILSLVCILCCQVFPIYADTDGTEMQVVQPEQLEIQLGTNWAGVEFQLKTDAGLYPDTIAVGEDGILKLEIGGSSFYTLSCIGSAIIAPDPDTEFVQVPATTETAEPINDVDISDSLDSTADESDVVNIHETHTIAGIPVLHIALFVGGLLLAIAALVVMRITANKSTVDMDYEEDDED